MKSKLFSMIILEVIVVLILWRTDILANVISRNSTAQAVGDLTIDWGVPAGQPIFTVDDFLPGETKEKTVAIFNGAFVKRPVGIVGTKTEEIKELANVLEIEISEAGTELYGGSLGTKTLAQFFQESAIPNAIFLFNLNPGESKQVKFKIKFQEGAYNSFQSAKIVFDILIGIYYQIPEECRNVKFSGMPIFGTSGNNILRGTNSNDLIFGFEGNDKIDGSNGDDCLIGGLGNDRIFGSNGNDRMLGNEGNDFFDGSNGGDWIFGGDGNDTVNAGNGNDYVEGNGGSDNLHGGNGNDTLLGGEGNDIVRGDLGVDRCKAEKEFDCEL